MSPLGVVPGGHQLCMDLGYDRIKRPDRKEDTILPCSKGCTDSGRMRKEKAGQCQRGWHEAAGKPSPEGGGARGAWRDEGCGGWRWAGG